MLTVNSGPQISDSSPQGYNVGLQPTFMCSRSNVRCHGDECVLYQSAVQLLFKQIWVHILKSGANSYPLRGYRGLFPLRM
jgi:hypothetical protein